MKSFKIILFFFVGFCAGCTPCINISTVEYMQALRVSAAVCVAGWLAIYFAEVLTFHSLKSFVLITTKPIPFTKSLT